jgi:hypothetical protein
VTAAALPGPSLDLLQRHVLALLLLAIIGLRILGAVWAASAPPGVDCKYHSGPFDNHFSTAFDISSFDCRMSEDWTIHFWSVPPYVGLEPT